jgi:hypothetical protein
MISTDSVGEFLAGKRLAVVGASDDKSKFGNTIYRALRNHGYDVVAVNPHADHVAGDVCYPDVGDVPTPLDGVVIVVGRASAVDVVRACVRHHVPRIWLFKGLGGEGAVSDEAVELCNDNGIDVIAGACPLMFLQPVGWFHKLHRGMRHLNGSLSKAS